MNTSLKYDLDKAHKHLSELQNDLPDYHMLLTDAAGDAQRLKEQRASLDAQAKGRLGVAKELLEQHQAEIQAARAEVARLEAKKHREQLLAKMHTAADTAKTHREAMDKAFENATKAMHRATELLLREWTGEHEARRQFAQVGAELVPRLNSLSDPVYAGMTGDQRLRFEAGRATLLDELLERGVPLDYATDGVTGQHSGLDKYAERELPRDELSILLWQASLVIAGPRAQPFARFVPKPKHPIRVH